MLFRRRIICLVLVIVLMGVLACSVEPAQRSELNDHEVMALIQNDTEIILQHFNSLARTSYGKNYLADLLERDLQWSYELRWHEDGQEAGKTLGTNDEIYAGVTQEQVTRAQYHKVVLSLKDSPAVIGTWLIYPNDRVVPLPRTLRVEAELVK